MAKTVVADPDNGNVSKLLEPYIQSGAINFLLGSGASFPAIATAGNIEAEIDALLMLGDNEDADKKSFAFLEAINAVNRDLLSGTSGPDAVAVRESYQRFIRILDGILFARKSQLLARQAVVFTTNYDLFLETAGAATPGLVVNDGFDRSAPLSVPVFAPERYFDRIYRASSPLGRSTEVPTINLVKLHGSLSWRRAGDELVARDKFPPPPAAGDLDDEHLRSTYLKDHFLILPNLRKFHSTLMDRVYYDLLRLFSRCLEVDNAVLLTFGFSFVDKHILDLTRRSLRNPTAQLILVAFDPTAAEGFATTFAAHRNVTVIAPSAGATIDFTRLNDILEAVVPDASK
ncbi:SIR2 family protein [Phenylobacterium sp. 58.2.17]|uniref:SIR2 family protein n=1 Tax=Phenylobacterium sp. 58.2.17 TaxID=2969306 RepID=UPI0022647AD0|nr:SIR2 family protein [Phenylobacterium sp. 58.2.17]MCX7587776.1 SIR2 family protein [Phenylobacterium sp. 58.2.17]